MKDILITGASGFLGSALALRLLKDGYHVHLLGRRNSAYGRLRGLENQFSIGYCGSDSEVLDFLSKTKPDTVIHTACAYGRANESSLQILDANVRFGVSILQGLVELRRPVNFINTGTVLSSDVSLYALSKNLFLEWGCHFTNRHDFLRFINIRLQHIYGPGDDITKFTTHVIHACQLNESFLKLTSGEQKRDFIFIDDAVNAYATLLIHAHSFAATTHFDVGSGVALSVKNFVETAHILTNSKTKLMFGAVPYRDNEAMNCLANLERISELGWLPKFDLHAGISKTIELDFKQ